MLLVDLHATYGGGPAPEAPDSPAPATDAGAPPDGDALLATALAAGAAVRSVASHTDAMAALAAGAGFDAVAGALLDGEPGERNN